MAEINELKTIHSSLKNHAGTAETKKPPMNFPGKKRGRNFKTGLN
jgi:hypothetical protein